MNNQREIYEALLAGETLIHVDSNLRMSLEDGNLVYDYTRLDKGEFNPEFKNFNKWKIYEEPMEFWVNVYRNKREHIAVAFGYRTEREALAVKGEDCVATIKVREVTE